MPITLRIDEPNHVVIGLKAGKPNLKLPANILGPDDDRVRVPQKGCPEYLCWQYAHQILSSRVGHATEASFGSDPILLNELKKRREFEQGLSRRRRLISKAYNDLKDKVRAIETQGRNIDDIKEAQEAETEFYKKQYIIDSIAIQELGLLNKYKQYCDEFENKHINALFDIYYEEHKHIQSLRDDYFKRAKTNRYVEIQSRHHGMTNTFLMEEHARQSHLENTAWTPNSSASETIAMLKTKGPFTLNISISVKRKQRFHGLDSKLKGYDVEFVKEFYVSDGAEMFQSLHAIVIIGAMIDNQGKAFLYYKDPSDKSDPKNNQTIYLTAYEKLAKHAEKMLPSVLVYEGKRLIINAPYGHYQPLYSQVAPRATDTTVAITKVMSEVKACQLKTAEELAIETLANELKPLVL